MGLQHLQGNDGERNEYHLDIKIGIREFARGMDSNKDNAGDRIHPETNPQNRSESIDSRQLYCRCEAEYSKVHARTDAHHKSHSDGVHKQNAGVGKQRIRFPYPLAEAALFNVKQKLRHIATQNITNSAHIPLLAEEGNGLLPDPERFRIVFRNCGRSMSAGMLGVVFVLISSWAQAQVAGPDTMFTATSVNVNDAGRGVRINILHWSNDDDRNALVAAMNPPAQRGNAEPAGERGRGGSGRGAAGTRGRGRGDAPVAPPNPMAALIAALERAPTIGYVWLNDSNIGYAIRYAYRAPMPDGGERIILASNRRLGDTGTSWRPVAAATATDYDFTIIELRLDSKGSGEGKASINAKVVVDADAKTVALENYAAAPMVLKNVRR